MAVYINTCTFAWKNRGELRHWSQPGSKGHVRSLGTFVTAAIWCQNSVHCMFDSTWWHLATNAVVRADGSRILRKWVFECTYGQLQECPVKVRRPTHCNLNGRWVTAPPFVLSPSSILPLPASHCAFIPARKFMARFSSMLLFQIYLCFWNCLSLKFRNLKLHDRECP